MKTLISTTSVGRKLGLITSIITLLGGFSTNAAPAVLVNETFDPPTLTLFGWDGDAANITRQYVNTGVGASMAVQISASLLDAGAYVGTMLYQNGVIFGNDLASTDNTVLSFDVKVDRPGLQYLVVGLESWSEFEWNTFFPGLVTGSQGNIPLGAYVPGQFKTITVALNDSLWVKELYGTWDGPFAPSGKTYQIWVQVEAGGLSALGPVTFTIDNVRVTTKNPMVPWRTTGTATESDTFDDAGNWVSSTVVETGVAEHLGNYTATITIHPVAWGYAGDIVLTAADGAQLLGSISGADGQAGVIIQGGTRRFQGSKGSYIVNYGWNGSAITVASTGRISNVGSNN